MCVQECNASRATGNAEGLVKEGQREDDVLHTSGAMWTSTPYIPLAKTWGMQ